MAAILSANKLGEAYVEIKANDAKFHKALRSAEKATRSFSTIAPKLLKGVAVAAVGVGAAFAAITAAISAAAIKATRDYAQFGHEIATVSTMIKDNVEENTAALADGVRKLSLEIPQSTSIMNAALYDILSASVPVNESLQMLELSGKAAVAGVSNVQTAANLATGTINALGLGFENANKVFDLAFSAVAEGKITFEELASSIGRALPSTNKMGASAEELYGSMAFLTKNTLSAEMAATAIGATYDQLAMKSADLEGMGIKIFGEEGDYVGIVGVIEQIAGKLEGLTEQAQVNVLEEMGFERQAARAIVTMTKNLDDFRQTMGDVADSAGATETAYAKMEDTLINQWTTLKNSFLNLSIEIGEGFAGIASSAITGIKGLVDGIAGFIDAGGGLTSLWVAHGDLVRGVFKDVSVSAVQLVGNMMSEIGNVVMAFAKVVWEPIKFKFMGMWETFKYGSIKAFKEQWTHKSEINQELEELEAKHQANIEKMVVEHNVKRQQVMESAVNTAIQSFADMGKASTTFTDTAKDSLQSATAAIKTSTAGAKESTEGFAAGVQTSTTALNTNTSAVNANKSALSGLSAVQEENVAFLYPQQTKGLADIYEAHMKELNANVRTMDVARQRDVVLSDSHRQEQQRIAERNQAIDEELQRDLAVIAKENEAAEKAFMQEQERGDERQAEMDAFALEEEQRRGETAAAVQEYYNQIESLNSDYRRAIERTEQRHYNSRVEMMESYYEKVARHEETFASKYASPLWKGVSIFGDMPVEQAAQVWNTWGKSLQSVAKDADALRNAIGGTTTEQESMIDATAELSDELAGHSLTTALEEAQASMLGFDRSMVSNVNSMLGFNDILESSNNDIKKLESDYTTELSGIFADYISDKYQDTSGLYQDLFRLQTQYNEKSVELEKKHADDLGKIQEAYTALGEVQASVAQHEERISSLISSLSATGLQEISLAGMTTREWAEGALRVEERQKALSISTQKTSESQRDMIMSTAELSDELAGHSLTTALDEANQYLRTFGVGLATNVDQLVEHGQRLEEYDSKLVTLEEQKTSALANIFAQFMADRSMNAYTGYQSLLNTQQEYYQKSVDLESEYQVELSALQRVAQLGEYYQTQEQTKQAEERRQLMSSEMTAKEKAVYYSQEQDKALAAIEADYLSGKIRTTEAYKRITATTEFYQEKIQENTALYEQETAAQEKRAKELQSYMQIAERYQQIKATSPTELSVMREIRDWQGKFQGRQMGTMTLSEYIQTQGAQATPGNANLEGLLGQIVSELRNQKTVNIQAGNIVATQSGIDQIARDIFISARRQGLLT